MNNDQFFAELFLCLDQPWNEEAQLRLVSIASGEPSEAEQAAAEAAGPEPDFPPPSIAE